MELSRQRTSASRSKPQPITATITPKSRDEFLEWNTRSFDQFFDLTRELLHPPRSISLRPMIGSKENTASLLKRFHERARQRNSADQVKRDIENLAECYVRNHRSLRFRDLPSKCQEVLNFYKISLNNRYHSKFDIKLLQIGPIFPNAVCECVQRSGLRAKSGVDPDQVALGCPLFVCDATFIFLIPRHPDYDCWFELHLRFRILHHQNRAKYSHQGLCQEEIREVCEEERRIGHLSEENRVFYLTRLIKIARLLDSDLKQLFQEIQQVEPTRKIPASQGFQPQPIEPIKRTSHITANVNNNNNKRSTSGKVDQCRSVQRSSLPPTAVSDNHSFAESFFAWSTSLNLTGPYCKHRSDMREVFLVPEDIDLYSVARTFYAKAKKLTPREVSADLSLLISCFIEHGPYVTTAITEPAILRLIDFYDIINNKNQCENSSHSQLTLSRLARLFPWIVCQYVQYVQHQQNIGDEFATPLYMAHPSFASLIPRNHAHDEQFEQHLKCHFEVYKVTPGYQLVRRDIATRMRYTEYLTDSQRSHLLEGLDSF